MLKSKYALSKRQAAVHGKKVSIVTNTSNQSYSTPLQNRYSSLSSVEDVQQ